MTKDLLGEAREQVAQNLLILSFLDSVVWVRCSFFLPFGIFGGDGLGWGCNGGIEIAISLSAIDGGGDLGFPGLIVAIVEFVGDGEEGKAERDSGRKGGRGREGSSHVGSEINSIRKNLA